jgi:hypothetical protein
MSRPYTKLERIDADLEKYYKDLRKEHKVPGAVVPSTRTLKSHDIFTTRLIHDLKHDPLETLVELSRTCKSELVKAQINLTLLEYMLPKLKAIDTNPNQGEMISINVVLPGQAQPIQAEIAKPGTLPPASTLNLNYDFEERNH